MPTSNVLEFLNSSFLLVRIKSMHVGLEDWKQVGDFIKLSRLNKVVKSARYLLSTEELKSPIKMILKCICLE